MQIFPSLIQPTERKSNIAVYNSALNIVQQIAFWCESHTGTVFKSFWVVDLNVCFLHVPLPLSLFC